MKKKFKKIFKNSQTESIMISEIEAQDLMKKYLLLKSKLDKNSKSNKLKKEFKAHQNLCMEKFSYLITMRTNKYKGYANYEDLNQEGFCALLNAMNNYDHTKGSFFYWAHKYIETRIIRSANNHATIRYPLHFAKNHPPLKVIMPLLTENSLNPDKQLEDVEVKYAIEETMQYLTTEEENIVKKVFGLDGDKPESINKVCKEVGISRTNCIKVLNNAVMIMREKIKL